MVPPSALLVMAKGAAPEGRSLGDAACCGSPNKKAAQARAHGGGVARAIAGAERGAGGVAALMAEADESGLARREGAVVEVHPGMLTNGDCRGKSSFPGYSIGIRSGRWKGLTEEGPRRPVRRRTPTAFTRR